MKAIPGGGSCYQAGYTAAVSLGAMLDDGRGGPGGKQWGEGGQRQGRERTLCLACSLSTQSRQRVSTGSYAFKGDCP